MSTTLQAASATVSQASEAASQVVIPFSAVTLSIWAVVMLVIGAVLYTMNRQQKLRAKALASMRDAEQAQAEAVMRSATAVRQLYRLSLTGCETYSGDLKILKAVLPPEYDKHIKHVVCYTGTFADIKPDLKRCLDNCYELGFIRGSKTMDFLAGRKELENGQKLYVILTTNLTDNKEVGPCIPWCYVH
jgi:hypothetical protein